MCAAAGIIAQLALADSRLIGEAGRQVVASELLPAQQPKDQAKKVNQFEGTIKKIEGNKITITKIDKNKKVDVVLVSRDNATFIAQLPSKIKVGDKEIDLDPALLDFGIAGRKVEVDDKFQFTVPGGLKGLIELFENVASNRGL